MIFVISSPDVVAPQGVPNQALAKVLINASAQGNPTGVCSNHRKPPWFQAAFSGSGVEFIQWQNRQSGEIISENAKHFNLHPYDAIVLAANLADLQMGKNGGAVLVAAGWSADAKVQELGIRVASPAEFQEVVSLVSNWGGHWWYEGNMADYSVRALADLSQYGRALTQQVFADKVKTTVKSGGGRLNALLAVVARSMLIDGVGAKSLWGVYPSSNSTNNDREILSDFAHRLRTTVSRSHFAERGAPLFIRHTPSPKRSAGGGGDRTDPASQVQTIHLNSHYAGSLKGKNVIVVDDCTTYGVSFGVASAFLKKAGAASVTGVALGKFGNQLNYYEIDIKTNPFAPVAAGAYSVKQVVPFVGTVSTTAQQSLQSLIP